VVATAVGGIPFLIDDGRTGFLAEPQKTEQMAQALVRLSRDHVLRRKMGQAAREEALERFRPITHPIIHSRVLNRYDVGKRIEK
jgi:glycosyltransferase involved in cell wall biosynthesis